MTTFRLTVTKTGVVSALADLPQSVANIYYQGNFKSLLLRPRVAIVGSRKASAYGRQVTSRLAAELAKAGVIIISGLAMGIDSIAHRATIEAGGQTIAVLPVGLSAIYPSMHHSLAKQIIDQGGALVSEHPDSQTNVMKHHFIARNRIIAGLSQAVIVTEAAAKSGSLHTAQFALEQGIDVYAVPGNITSPTSEGTNNLLQSGALVATRTRDILEGLGISPPASTESAYKAANSEEAAILSILQKGPKNSADLLYASRLSPAQFQQTLSILEVQGAIIQTAPQLWAKQ